AALAGGLRAPPPDRLPGRLDAGDPPRRLDRDRRRDPRHPPRSGRAPAADRPVHRRPRRAGRGDPVDRTLSAAIMEPQPPTAGPGTDPAQPRDALAPAEPAAPHADAKRRLAAAVVGAADEIVDLSHRIHAAPEVAFEERQAAGWIADVLRRHGYAVEHPAGSLETAIRATRRGGRSGDGPRIAILAEYDALPGLGHGCGHNTMAASG